MLKVSAASGPGADVEVAKEILEPDEVARLIGACSRRSSSGLRNRALVATLYRAGPRVGELLALLPADARSEDRTLRVRRGDRVREVTLDPSSFRIIERWIERRRELGLPPDVPLFCTLSGKPLAPSYLRGLLHRLAEQAGVDKRVSAEVLRRSLAVELVKEGFSIVEIQAQLGHAIAAATSRYLTRLASGTQTADLARRREWFPDV